jgi:hypothetical protein
MEETLSKNDYINILSYYKKSVPKSLTSLKKQAENILNLKLCRCINKLKPKFPKKESAIGICTRTVFTSKGLTRKHNFSCTASKKRNKKQKTKKNK